MELPHLNGLMFLPNVADGTATYVTAELADVIAIVVDGITTFEWADVFTQCSRWNSHICDS